MNAQSLPDNALFQKVHLFVVKPTVAVGVLLDVFQREGNVRYLVGTHAGVCVRSGLVAVLEVGIDVNTVGGFALNFHVALIECRTDRAVIHYLFHDTDTLRTFCPVSLFRSMDGGCR